MTSRLGVVKGKSEGGEGGLGGNCVEGGANRESMVSIPPFRVSIPCTQDYQSTVLFACHLPSRSVASTSSVQLATVFNSESTYFIILSLHQRLDLPSWKLQELLVRTASVTHPLWSIHIRYWGLHQPTRRTISHACPVCIILDSSMLWRGVFWIRACSLGS